MDTLSGKGYERQVMRYLAERDQTIAFELTLKFKTQPARIRAK